MKRSLIRSVTAITVLLIWAVCTSARPQNVRSISGTVTDAVTGQPIEFATVALIAPDNTVVSDLITDLSAVPQQDAVIFLEPDTEMLEEAVVTARRPVIEQKLDKIVMNIADAVSTEGSNGTDLLRKAPGVTIDFEGNVNPGVTIDFDGNVKLNGSTVAVWLDGRPSNLSGKELEVLLQSTDGTTIDRIEIMAHPSAKYDAAGGGGIINIVTKKNFMQGFNGSVNLGYGGMYFDRWDQSGDQPQLPRPQDQHLPDLQRPLRRHDRGPALQVPLRSRKRIHHVRHLPPADEQLQPNVPRRQRLVHH